MIWQPETFCENEYQICISWISVKKRKLYVTLIDNSFHRNVNEIMKNTQL